MILFLRTTHPGHRLRPLLETPLSERHREISLRCSHRPLPQPTHPTPRRTRRFATKHAPESRHRDRTLTPLLRRNQPTSAPHRRAALNAPSPAITTPPALDLPAQDLDRIIGRSGKVAGGTYQFAVPRAETITEDGEEIPPSMGMAIPLNFQPTGNGRAAVTGDFVLVAGEVNRVIRILRGGGIAVTALHSHMIDESPRLFFMQFCANDDSKKLATTLRSALYAINMKK